MTVVVPALGNHCRTAVPVSAKGLAPSRPSGWSPRSLPHEGGVRQELPSRPGDQEWEAAQTPKLSIKPTVRPPKQLLKQGRRVYELTHPSVFLVQRRAQSVRRRGRLGQAASRCEGPGASLPTPPSPDHLALFTPSADVTSWVLVCLLTSAGLSEAGLGVWVFSGLLSGPWREAWGPLGSSVSHCPGCANGRGPGFSPRAGPAPSLASEVTAAAYRSWPVTVWCAAPGRRQLDSTPTPCRALGRKACGFCRIKR